MGFFHLFNCVVLTFGPFVVVNKATVLGRESRAMLMLQVVGVFLLAQVTKMIVSATFLPSHPESVDAVADVEAETPQFSLPKELTHLAISPDNSTCVLDLVALWYLLGRRAIRKDHESPVLAVGFAWALVEALFTRLVPLAYNAGGTEFSWQWIQAALAANVQLVKIVACAALVSVCYAAKQRAGPIFYVFLFALLASSLVDTYVATVVADSWTRLAVSAATVLSVALLTYLLRPTNMR